MSESEHLTDRAARSVEESHRIASVIQEIAEGAQQQAHSVTETTDAMREVQKAIDQIAWGAREQTDRVHVTMEQIRGMADEVQSVADLAHQVANASAEGVQLARNGGDAVRDSVRNMAQIRAATEDATSRVRALGEQSEQIGEIVRMIGELADQTNLLALNAAIEAARAGEHGRGFAVVADEVRRLAENSLQSTVRITELVDSIRAGVQEAVEAMDIGMSEVEAGAEFTGKAGEALDSILRAIERTDVLARNIAETARRVSGTVDETVQAVAAVATITEESAAATEEMAASGEQVGESMETVASISEQTAAAAEEVTASTEKIRDANDDMLQAIKALGEKARVLHELMIQFKLADEPGKPTT